MRSLLSSTAILSVMAMGLASEARGQDGRVSASGSDEIIVTAQRREERLIDVPISIVALGAEELDKRNVSSVDDLPAAVPGLAVIGSGGFQRRILLRGISNSFGAGSLISVYLDEAPLTPGDSASELDVRTYDLERVEVLRGPQGTLYGVGASGGTIRYVTRNPDLGRLDARADLETAFTKGGSPSQKVEAAVNVPLVTDSLGLRIVGIYDHRGGWVDQPAVAKKDINKDDIVHFRAKALWKPAPDLAVNAMAIVHRNNGSLGGRSEDRNGNFRQLLGFTTTPEAEDDYELYNLTLSYDFSAARLLASSTFLDGRRQSRNFGSEAQLVAPPAPGREGYNFEVTSDNRVFTQELRLISRGSSPLQWTVGGLYQESEGGRYDRLTIAGLSPTPLYLETDGTSEKWAAFADASYDVAARLSVGAGVRYFEEKVTSRAAPLGIGAPLPLGAEQAATFDAFSPRVYLQFKPVEHVSLYASASKGFRSGGFNSVGQPSFGPENLWTYELGAKLALAGGDVNLEGAIFQSDYDDYQVRGLVVVGGGVPINIVSNAGKARIRGAEFALRWRPVERLTLAFSGSYTDAKLVEVNAGAPYIAGDRLDLVPEYNYNISADYEWDLGGYGGYLRADYSEQGRSVYRNRTIGPWYAGESGIINLLNISASMSVTENFRVGLFVRNVLDERAQNNPFGRSDNIATRERPRTLGFQVSIGGD